MREDEHGERDRRGAERGSLERATARHAQRGGAHPGEDEQQRRDEQGTADVAQPPRPQRGAGGARLELAAELQGTDAARRADERAEPGREHDEREHVAHALQRRPERAARNR